MAKETEQYPIVDYKLFRNILTTLADSYPDRLRMSQIPSLVIYGVKNAGRPLCYLREQGLIDMDVQKILGGRSIGGIKITAKGIDFLRSDGGLSALAAPVIRIAPENLIAIIDAALAARGVSAVRRGAVQKALGVAKAETVKTLVHRLVETGIAHLPDIDSLLHMLA